MRHGAGLADDRGAAATQVVAGLVNIVDAEGHMTKAGSEIVFVRVPIGCQFDDGMLLALP